MPITVIMYADGTRITASHLPFVERWLPISVGWSTDTQFMLNCCLPVLPCARVHWTRKLASNSLDVNSVDYSVWGIATDNVLSPNFRHWLTEMHANRLLNSAKPGHNELSDQSAANKTDDGYQGKGWPRWIVSGISVCKWSLLLLLLYLWVKNWIKSNNFVNFSRISRVVNVYAN